MVFEVSIGKFDLKYLKFMLAGDRMPIVYTDPFLTDTSVPTHAVLIVGIDEEVGGVHINDPYFSSPQVASLKQFEIEWSNKVVHTVVTRKLWQKLTCRLHGLDGG